MEVKRAVNCIDFILIKLGQVHLLKIFTKVAEIWRFEVVPPDLWLILINQINEFGDFSMKIVKLIFEFALKMWEYLLTVQFGILSDDKFE